MLSTPFDEDRWRHRLLLVLLESVLIVMGVLLGYFANQYRIAQQNQERADAALQAIHTELRPNYRQVRDLLPEHRRMEDSLDGLVQRIATGQEDRVSAAEFRRRVVSQSGFSTPLLRTDAWEIAKETGSINHIDVELASDLSRLYNQQEYYQSKLDKVGENWYVSGNVNPSNFASTVFATGILVNDIVNQEEDLIERYQKVLDSLGESGV